MTPLSGQDGGPDQGSLYCVSNGFMTAGAQHGVNHIVRTSVGNMHDLGSLILYILHCINLVTDRNPYISYAA